MKKNIIIITLSALVLSLGIYCRVLFINAKNTEVEMLFVREEVKQLKHRSEMLTNSANKEAAKAVMFEAKFVTALEELEAAKLRVADCK